ncbi:MAG: hypothetical protein K6E50_11255 [Lachnospiraceae bacterium]|nr:hypothetical protein [Lachnospiraceae bacterium]
MEDDVKLPQKKNKLKTKLLPSLFMLLGGSIALILGLLQHFPMTELLLVLLITLFVFAILGTVVKEIVDRFNMNIDYSDYFEDAGDLVEKGGPDDNF